MSGELEVKFHEWDCHVAVSHYTTPPHPIALYLVAARTDRKKGVWEGENIAVATVFLDGVELGPREVAIKSWEENAGMAEALQRAGVIGPELRRVQTGHVEASIHFFLTS